PPPAAITDVESGTTTAREEGGVSNIVRRWRREDLVKRGSLAARGVCFLFSFIAFLLMASNKHGDGENFDVFEEYRYVLAIAILSSLYTGLQTAKQIHEHRTGTQIFSGRNPAISDFVGDQIVAYLLISAASSAIPLTNRLRQVGDNIFTDTSASAIALEILAFLSLAFSALISGYKLSNQSYI
ncbi:hypothetical protein M569_00354, partial [Genlisea aurea]